MSNPNLGGKRTNIFIMAEYRKIIESDLPEADRVARAFTLVTDMHIQEAEKEIELAKAMSDQENLVKGQIKHNVIQFVQGIFKEAYWQVTGKQVEDVWE